MSLSDDQIISLRTILEEVVSRVSPDELMLVEPAVAGKPSDTKLDGMLGFGHGPELLLVTPVLAAILKEFAATTGKELAKKWGKTLSDWMASRDRDIPASDAYQQLQETLICRLQGHGFSAQQAAQVADCLVATLSTRPDLLRNLARPAK